MRDLDGDLCPAPDIDRLVPRSDNLVLLVADVTGIHTAEWTEGRCERDQLGRLGVEARVVLESAGKPDRAVLHRAVDERAHHGDFAVRCRALEVGAKHQATYGAVPDAGGDVDRRTRRIDAFQEIRNGKVASAILADERGRDSLLNLAQSVGAIHQTTVRMAVHVHEPRRHDAIGGIDDDLAITRCQLRRNLDDRVAGDAHVNLPRWTATAVDDTAVSHEQRACGLALDDQRKAGQSERDCSQATHGGMIQNYGFQIADCGLAP